jgi:uncharacterized protein (DUF2267 family)
MSATSVTALDHTIQETNIWLRDISEELSLDDRHRAYDALRAVLHTLRDRLPPDVAVHFGAQLPILVRGIYYEGWHMAGTPTKERTVQHFVDHVMADLPPAFPLDPLAVCRAVFEILWERLDPGAFDKLMEHLPEPIRTLRTGPRT